MVQNIKNLYQKKIIKQTVVVLNCNLHFNLTNYEIKSLQIYFNKEIKSGSSTNYANITVNRL